MTETADFVVVGAGIAGASAAYFLADHGSVMLFEMERTPGHHSTGRSAALYTECDGPAVIRHITLASREFLTDPPDGFSPDPILHDRGVMFVALEENASKVSSFYTEQRSIVDSVERLTPQEAARLCPVVRPETIAGGVLEPDAKDIDVHALHGGFLRGLRAKGGHIATASPVVGLATRRQGWTVTTPQHTVDAGVVVNAAGAWCDEVADLAGIAPIGLQPKRRTAFTFSPPAEMDHSSWPMVVEFDHDFYFRPEGPHLLGSPGDQTPVLPQDIRHDELDVAIAIDRIQRVTTMEITHVRSAWAGLRSFVPDNIPAVGFEPDSSAFFWLAGQGGYGIMTSPALGMATAGLITDGTLPRQLTSLGVDPSEISPRRFR